MAQEQKNIQKFDTEYRNLNSAQKQAVDAIDGPVLVVAGPGSGKTKVLTMRAANILKETDANPSNILCLTFTESAAMNMSRRLAELIGKDAYKMAIHTFHSFGVEIISRYPEYFFGGASFYPADELVQLEVLEGIFKRFRYDDPLNTLDPQGKFVFLKEASQAIQQIKKAGFTADEFERAIEHNAKQLEKLGDKVDEVFSKTASKKIFGEVENLLTVMRKIKSDPFPAGSFQSITVALADSLEDALNEAQELDKATPLSDWKKANTVSQNSRRVLKDADYLEKMRSLADVYQSYAKQMYELQYYDYEDMLLEVIGALEKYSNFKHELWEQFQYIQVDEFQDTNDAQMRLLYLLTEAEVSEGRPNICAVGDDDQAIYKFQGALLSNILDFRGRYRDPKMVVLTENYRSTEDILALAQFFIRQGEERLEKLIPELQKTLVASNKELGAGEIRRKHFPTDLEEYSWVAREIRRLIDEGEEPKNITVIARNHKELQEFSKYLDAVLVPTYYERNQNVFDEPHVHELVQMARFVSSLLKKDRDEADEFLPEILSFPFWGIERKTIWNVSTRAEREKYHRQKWLDVMLVHENERVREVAEFLLEVSHFAKSHTLFETLDMLIGEHTSFEEVDEEASKKKSSKKKTKRAVIESPFKSYYFGEEQFDANRLEYLNFLSALQVFVSAVREYRHGEEVTLDDLVTFVDRHEEFNIPVVDKSPFVGSDNAVVLLSAHKAKGLEFQTVFLLSCQEEIWQGRARGDRLPFPKNLPIKPAGDTTDDHLRLFFVAVTRAKERLSMNSHEKKSDGRQAKPLQFFEIEEAEPEKSEKTAETDYSKIARFIEPDDKSGGEAEILKDSRDALLDHWKALHAGPYVADEEAMLRKLLEDYQMSPTHLNNFLNVPKGGPAHFLEQSLLHFPQAKAPAMCYGTAMHGAIEDIYTHLRFKGELPSEDYVLERFQNILLKERLTKLDYEKWRVRGEEALQAYFREKQSTFNKDHWIETKFKNQGVVIGNAWLTGAIDKMVFDGDVITVVDFKTGKPAANWKGKDDSEKQKLHRYQNQLLFYKLLVENSGRFGGKYQVTAGVLEYVEPKNGKFFELALEMSREETERLEKLIEVVYAKIMNLDFPDTAGYSKDLKGIKQFEEDLLEGRV